MDNGFHSSFLLDRGVFHVVDRFRFDFLGLEEAKPQGVGDHKYGAEAHGCCADHGVQENAESGIQCARCHGNAQAVIEECPEQIFPDIADGGTAQGV